LQPFAAGLGFAPEGRRAGLFCASGDLARNGVTLALANFILSVKLVAHFCTEEHSATMSLFVTTEELRDRYRGYIDCLNRQDWAQLGDYVAEDVQRNGEKLGLAGYRRMLEGDFAAIPDLFFKIDFIVSEPPHVAARLVFDCTPKGELFGLPVNGKRVSFTENVFYRFRDGKIDIVWSVIDQAAIAAQL
jgi:predicted ester cyclase